jgi:rare lipoprotein A
VKRTTQKIAVSLLLAVAPSLCLQSPAAHASDKAMNPQVVAKVWNENNQDYASVCINGKELVSFRGEASEDQAEDLAEKLQDMIEDKDFDAANLIPGRNGSQGTLVLEGTPVMSFPSPQESNPLELSWKIANGLRTAFGEPLVPQSFLKLADQIAQDNRKPSGWISGQASWYGPRFHGRKTSDGSRFDQEGMTAAHRSLPFGTKLLVMNRKTGNSCVVKVNDRGPFVGDRVIDLSRGAARQLNMLSSGVAMVDCVVLGSGAASGD